MAVIDKWDSYLHSAHVEPSKILSYVLQKTILFFSQRKQFKNKKIAFTFVILLSTRQALILFPKALFERGDCAHLNVLHHLEKNWF